MPITTKFVSSNPVHGEVYSIQHNVIKFVSDLQQVSGFPRVLWFPPPIKTDHHDITEILLKVALNTINQPKKPINQLYCILQVSDDKELRTKYHQAIKSKFPDLETSTVTIEGAKVIKVVKKSDTKSKYMLVHWMSI